MGLGLEKVEPECRVKKLKNAVIIMLLSNNHICDCCHCTRDPSATDFIVRFWCFTYSLLSRFTYFVYIYHCVYSYTWIHEWFTILNKVTLLVFITLNLQIRRLLLGISKLYTNLGMGYSTKLYLGEGEVGGWGRGSAKWLNLLPFQTQFLFNMVHLLQPYNYLK